MRKLPIIFILALSLMTASCSNSSTKKNETKSLPQVETSSDTVDANKSNNPLNTSKSVSYRKIMRYPSESCFPTGNMGALPKYDPESGKLWQVDLRSYNLSNLNITDRLNDLLNASFDSKTKWPEKLPEGFDPEAIMENGKNPGLGVHKLHENGITGNGISIAIIDAPLLVDHIEYGNNIKLYEEIHWPDKLGTANMHGSAVASIAVGNTVGVAPEADLYYIVEQHGENNNNVFSFDFTWLAKSIDRVLEINKTLPKHNKIRVISISVAWNEGQKGYKEVMAAVKRAKEEGIFIVSSSLSKTFGFAFQGLDRDPLGNPDQMSTYKPSAWWEKSVYNGEMEERNKKYGDSLLVPMDSRTTASPTGNNDYVYYEQGGWSWAIPYIAGLYALACQVDPDITPAKFWKTALDTGEPLNAKKNGKEYYVGKIANPVKLINKLKK